MIEASLTNRGDRLKYFLYAALISAAYLVISHLLIGFRPSQLYLTIMFDVLYLLSPATRRLVLGFSPFLVFWILFDYMKGFPNYQYNTIHIESLYQAEKALFGIGSGSQRLTPNEFFALHGNTFLDVLCGFFYLCWMPLPLLFAGYLYYRNKPEFYRFSYTFLLINIIGFVIYYVYPAAPPWYVALYGNHFDPHTPGNTAGLDHFDRFFHVHVFRGLYAQSSNVFAAMPSLHASYPSVSLYYGLRNRIGAWNALFAAIMVGIWFTAVYTSHHYVLDVMAGIACTIIGILLFNVLAKKFRWFPLSS